jgi:alcohol dehydrogenase class IV
MPFQFRTAGQIYFGRGERKKAPALAASLGRRVLLVTGSSSLARAGHLAAMQAGLHEQAEHIEQVCVAGEPDIALADTLAQRCRDAACQVILAIGGGSVLDIGKAVAALSQNPGQALDYLEDVGRGTPRPLHQPPLPVVAVPTTAGSGSEVTRNSVLKVPELAVKRSLRSDLLLPRIALVDPDLLSTAPLHVAAAAGMDALTHLIEAYLSTGAQPTTDLLCTRGIELIWPALHRLVTPTQPTAGSDAQDVHEHLALASLWGGIALANAGLGAVHGLVAPLGGLCGVAHGDGCACLLPATFVANAHALLRRQPNSPALDRLRHLLRLLGQGREDLDEVGERLDRLRQHLGIRSLAEQGVTVGQFPSIIAQSRGGSMRSNPVELSDVELFDVLQKSWRGDRQTLDASAQTASLPPSLDGG